MRSLGYLMLPLALCSAAFIASGCATKAPETRIYPPIADLTVEAKPLADPAGFESEQAFVDHVIALEMWGERGWDAVARLCRWHADMGMSGLRCPPPRPRPRPG